MYLSAKDIANLEGGEHTHFLNPSAVRVNKSLGDLVGLQNLGAHLITIAPGFRSTEFHAHRFEEECVYVVSGRGSAVVGESTILIGPGDFLGFPTNGIAHELVNDGTEPLVCLVVGQRLDHDIIDFPRLHKRLYRHRGEWDVANFGDIDNTEARPAVTGVPPAERAPASEPEALRLMPVGRDGSVPAGVGELPEDARRVMQASADLYRVAGFEAPWLCYLGMVGGTCVGTCAFKAAPRDNRVEIAFYTFPRYEGRGFATAMATGLMDIAFENQPGIRVIAHTPAEENAATAVLTKLGFHLTGRGHDTDEGEVWEWMLQTAAS
jgi:uncharacterized cupin superfamily protein/RimJ/RimL family protein N-acetyltransferase